MTRSVIQLNTQLYLSKQSTKINKALEFYLPKPSEHPVLLHRAIRYAVMSGGKRIRPVLALAACEAVGGDEKKVMPAACAIEFIHNYSLVHDDLPCMDDDDARRGRMSCHKKFGEDTALLAGDALLTLAFKTITSSNGSPTRRGLGRTLNAAHWIADAVGTRGMVGGQAVDIEYKGREPDLATMEYINTHKSGALIAVSVKAGGYLGGGRLKEVERLHRFGKVLGLLFQIVDDIIDREGYAKIVGLQGARSEAQALLDKAKEELVPFGRKASALNQIADFILTRDF